MKDHVSDHVILNWWRKLLFKLRLKHARKELELACKRRGILEGRSLDQLTDEEFSKMEELFRKVGIGVREFVPAEQAIEGVSLQTAWNRALRKLLSPLPAPRWVWTTTLVVVGVGLGLVLGSFLSPWIQDSSQRGIEESRLEQLLKAEGIDLTDFDLTKAKSYTVQEETNTLREIAAQEYKDERYWIVLYILNYSRLQHLRAPAEVELPPGTPLILVEKK